MIQAYKTFMLGGPIMLILLVLSLAAAAVFVQRLLFARRAWEDPEEAEGIAADMLAAGRPAEALASVSDGPDTSLRRVLRAGLSHWKLSGADLRDLLQQEIRREAFRWSWGLGFLSVTARVAPLLGLLGTVVCMVDIFQALPEVSSSPMTALAGGIYKALFTTVAGLIIAIPALLAHSWCSSRVDRLEETLSRTSDLLLRCHMAGRGSHED